ncbi:DsbA family protein [bacterium LRH843]|nr:DsbA family protein [bacterium LRH843]
MNLKDFSTTCDNQLDVCGLDPNQLDRIKRPKPIELYTFIDPLCADCWAFEPILKKLQIEYGNYFRIRTLISGRLQSWNVCKDTEKGLETRKKEIALRWEKVSSRSGMSCDGDVWLEHDWSSPYLTSIAIKAAEFQGPHAGSRFLRKLREFFFLERKNITIEQVLIDCAEQAGLDCHEFKQDLSSQGAAKALKCDIKTTNEMDVTVVPTFVFFNNKIEEEGIKVTGIYPYHIYIQILEEMLGFKPTPAPPISLEQFLAQYNFVATIEVAVVFDLTEEEAERQLKTLMLQGIVELVPVKYGVFWRYIKPSV